MTCSEAPLLYFAHVQERDNAELAHQMWEEMGDEARVEPDLAATIASTAFLVTPCKQAEFQCKFGAPTSETAPPIALDRTYFALVQKGKDLVTANQSLQDEVVSLKEDCDTYFALANEMEQDLNEAKLQHQQVIAALESKAATDAAVATAKLSTAEAVIASLKLDLAQKLPARSQLELAQKLPAPSHSDSRPGTELFAPQPGSYTEVADHQMQVSEDANVHDLQEEAHTHKQGHHQHSSRRALREIVLCQPCQAHDALSHSAEAMTYQPRPPQVTHDSSHDKILGLNTTTDSQDDSQASQDESTYVSLSFSPATSESGEHQITNSVAKKPRKCSALQDHPTCLGVVMLHPRRKADDSKHPVVQGRHIQKDKNKTKRPLEFSKSTISLFFDLPQGPAAEAMGISVTSLKHICRRLGLTRWPFKKNSPKCPTQGGSHKQQLGRIAALPRGVSPLATVPASASHRLPTVPVSASHRLPYAFIAASTPPKHTNAEDPLSVSTSLAALLEGSSISNIGLTTSYSLRPSASSPPDPHLARNPHPARDQDSQVAHARVDLRCHTVTAKDTLVDPVCHTPTPKVHKDKEDLAWLVMTPLQDGFASSALDLERVLNGYKSPWYS